MKALELKHNYVFSAFLRYIRHRLHYRKRLRFHVMSHMFLSDFNNIPIFSTDFRKSPQHQILRISIQSEPRWYMQTDGQADI